MIERQSKREKERERERKREKERDRDLLIAIEGLTCDIEGLWVR